MRSENEPDGQKRSFIEEARRAQIIAAAIETIAESGYANASLARIAQRVGISKGVISYHFKGKAELVDQVMTAIYTSIGEAAYTRIQAQDNASDMLRTHIGAVADFGHQHPSYMRAIGEIAANARDADGNPVYGPATSEGLYQGLEHLYQLGQDSGEFRGFDTRVMAVTQQAAIDGMFGYWAAHPDHDLHNHARELGELLVRAVRADP